MTALMSYKGMTGEDTDHAGEASEATGRRHRCGEHLPLPWLPTMIREHVQDVQDVQGKSKGLGMFCEFYENI